MEHRRPEGQILAMRVMVMTMAARAERAITVLMGLMRMAVIMRVLIMPRCVTTLLIMPVLAVAVLVLAVLVAAMA